MKFECLFFDNISIVSQSLAALLHIKKFHLLPLGGEQFSINSKSFFKLHLLYVGTLENRNLIKCVEGLNHFLHHLNHYGKTEIIFSIIGDSPGNELKEIQDYVANYNLSGVIRTTGYIHNDRLYNFFEQANVGISFIPMTKYYDNQPPTKTFEYLISGLPVIATRTRENVRILKDNCGVLIDDTAASFAWGLQEIIKNKEFYTSENIREQYQHNLWEHIVHDNLEPYFNKLIKRSDFSLHEVNYSKV